MSNFLHLTAMIVPFLLGASSAYAKGSNCASAHILSGKGCKNLRVEFLLNECEDEAQPKITTTVKECRPNQALIEGETPQFRYRARLTREEGAWAQGEWMVSGPVRRTKKPKASPAVSQAELPAAPITAAPTPKDATGAVRPALAVNGFIDAQFQQSSRSETNRGFLINDGAVYLSQTFEEYSFKIDLPFQMSLSGSPDFQIGTIRAQAYVGATYASGWRWKIGQFDTTYGFEANDTVDVFFTRQGNVYNYTDPFVHTGLMASYDFMPKWTLNTYIASQRDTGMTQGRTPEFGLQAILTTDDIHGSGGFLINKGLSGYNQYYDFTLGGNIGKFAIDAEFSVNRPENSDLQFGSLLHLVYQANAQWFWGIRGEYITKRAPQFGPNYRWDSSASNYNFYSKDPGRSASHEQILVYAGPQLRLNDQVRLKLNYVMQRDVVAEGEAAQMHHEAHFAAVYRF